MNKFEKSFYLTFDGAPHAPNTYEILEALEKHGVKATFFMEGRRIENDPQCALAVLTHNHDVGNHSYSHPNFDEISLDACLEEVVKAESVMVKTFGFTPKFFRPPSGILTPESEKLILSRGYHIVLWSYSVKDWLGPDAGAVAQRILDGIMDNGVIVLHDHVQWVPKILDMIIPAIKNQGFLFRKISETSQAGIIR
ncbi:MAG: polysaccharide deacetylase family protein [Bacillota bacterium]